MHYIYLSGIRGKGTKTAVDESTLREYGHLTWHLSDTGYAVRRNKAEGGTVRLHRLVVNAPEDKVVDHLNGNRLDNRKINLRVCTQKDNANNRKGIKGYCYDKSRQKWVVHYKSKYYGRYNTQEEAIKAYQLAKSGVEYKKTRRKQYMLPKHISKQYGKYVVSVQIDGKRYRKTYIPTLEQAISIRDKYLENRG